MQQNKFFFYFKINIGKLKIFKSTLFINNFKFKKKIRTENS